MNNYAYTPYFKFIGFEFRKGEYTPYKRKRNELVMRVQFDNGIHGLYKLNKRFNQLTDVTNESITGSIRLVHGQYYRAFLFEGGIAYMQRNKNHKVEDELVTLLLKGTGNTQTGVLLAKTNDYIILRVGEKQEQHFHRSSWEII